MQFIVVACHLPPFCCMDASLIVQKNSVTSSEAQSHVSKQCGIVM